MQKIARTEKALVLRTDFSDDDAWQALCAAIQRPVGPFRAHVAFLSDAQYDGLTADQVPSLLAPDADHTFVFIVDRRALSNPDGPILAVDLVDDPGRTFRVVPPEMWSVENNLSLANMDFEDFTAAVDEDGVFRGFA